MRHKKYFEKTLGLRTCAERYASAPNIPMTRAAELAEGNWEWRRVMAAGEGLETPYVLLSRRCGPVLC